MTAEQEAELRKASAKPRSTAYIKGATMLAILDERKAAIEALKQIEERTTLGLPGTIYEEVCGIARDALAVTEKPLEGA